MYVCVCVCVCVCAYVLVRNVWQGTISLTGVLQLQRVLNCFFFVE